ncbi:hypothetical protein AgCh_016484 [Apium graveolens]
MLALPDGKGDFVKYSDPSHKGLGCVLMQHGKRRRLELIKNYDWEILYHSGKANMVADALSKKERLKMMMSFGEFIRDFEKMEIEVKGIQKERLKDNLRGFTRRKNEIPDSIFNIEGVSKVIEYKLEEEHGIEVSPYEILEEDNVDLPYVRMKL